MKTSSKVLIGLGALAAVGGGGAAIYFLTKKSASSGGSSTTPPVQQGPAATATNASGGKTFTIPVGQTLLVKLSPSFDASTGAAWQTQAPPEITVTPDPSTGGLFTLTSSGPAIGQVRFFLQTPDGSVITSRNLLPTDITINVAFVPAAQVNGIGLRQISPVAA